ncbi:FAD-binding domain-containing protein [Clathrospora elynae]|uniref:FAD-binding domain-containing protein n=1 Tax=Clathrospora elynae TaxID=706981 RepID=A0A6A5SFV9_9PLEO|nr:FAD-binding domain-containing protein [Clathrospora elynae]
MKFLVSLTAGLLSVGLAYASPAPLAKRAVSTDGSCGGSKGFTCQGSSFGNCCSQYGWCGSSTDHCGIGCNSAFGQCTSSSATSKPATTSKVLSTRAASPPTPTPTKNVSNDGTCGGSNGGSTCSGTSFGNCCSASGWCGSTAAYCGSGCQVGFGNCGSNTGAGSSSTSKTSPATPSVTPSGSALQCLNGKNVPYKMTSDSEYAGLVEPYNLRLPYKPAVVVLPITNQHVQDAVVCAAQAGLKVQAKSGGHSYASFSSGGRDGAMQINLQSLQTIQLDQGSGVATVGGGVRLGNLADGIFTQGNAAVSHGTCPGVGIGGHYTHGGYGHTSRNWGLAMDQVVAADVVLANGTLTKASSTQSPDIFWAIRGAAESFGIVTTFYVQTRAAPSSITYFEFTFSGIFNSKSVFTNTFLHIQDVAKNASVVDNRISFGIYLDGSGFSLSGAFFGTVDEFNSGVKPELLRTLPSAETTVQSMGWYDYLVKVSGESTIKTPVTGYDLHEDFFAKSVTVPESAGLTSKALGDLFDYLKTAGSVQYYIIINLYGGPGSAINSKDTNFAAYVDRDSLWVLQNYGYGGDSIDFINGINSAIINAQPQTSFGAYLNYVDPSYDAATAHKLYYGDVVYSRLAALKQQVDPQSVFWNPQAIGA